MPKRLACIVGSIALAAASAASAAPGDGFLDAPDDGVQARLSVGSGASGWQFLAYRAVPPREQPAYRPFCLALARGDAEPDANSGLLRCEYPPTFAARLLRRGWQHYRGPQLDPHAGRFSQPHWGIVLADVERVTLRSGSARELGKLSPPFRLSIPRLPARVRDQIENPRQKRMTAGLPRHLSARAFLAAVPYETERRHGFTLTFHKADGSSRVLARP